MQIPKDPSNIEPAQALDFTQQNKAVRVKRGDNTEVRAIALTPINNQSVTLITDKNGQHYALSPSASQPIGNAIIKQFSQTRPLPKKQSIPSPTALLGYLYRLFNPETSKVEFWLGGATANPIKVSEYDLLATAENFNLSYSASISIDENGNITKPSDNADILPAPGTPPRIGLGVGSVNYYIMLVTDLWTPFTIVDGSTQISSSAINNFEFAANSSSDCALFSSFTISAFYRMENVDTDFVSATNNQSEQDGSSGSSPDSMVFASQKTFNASSAYRTTDNEGFRRFLVWKTESSLSVIGQNNTASSSHSFSANINLQRANAMEAYLSGASDGNFYVSIKVGNNNNTSWETIDRFQINPSTNTVTPLASSSPSDWLSWLVDPTDQYNFQITPPDAPNEYYGTRLGTFSDNFNGYSYDVIEGNQAHEIDVFWEESVTLSDSSTDFVVNVPELETGITGTATIKIVTSDGATVTDTGETVEATVYSAGLTFEDDFEIEGYAVAG